MIKSHLEKELEKHEQMVKGTVRDRLQDQEREKRASKELESYDDLSKKYVVTR